MNEYLVFIKDNEGFANIFASTSRNSKQHLELNEGTDCWVYDNKGRWVSYAHKDALTGKIERPKILYNNKSNKKYAEILENMKMK